MTEQRLPTHDRELLRTRAAELAELATDPVNEERRAAWYGLDEGDAHRPMVLAEVGGVRDQKRPELQPACASEAGRRIEIGLLRELYQFHQLKDDHVIEPRWNVPWAIDKGDYGVHAVNHHSEAEVSLGARSWEHPIRDLDRDLEKLRPRELKVDRETTRKNLAYFEELFDGILDVRIRGSQWWTFGLTIEAIHLVGLENLMLYMFDKPDGLHALMTFLYEENLRLATWMQEEGLLTPNNENDYIGSGSIGYSRDLTPVPGQVRTQDMWILLESQETVGVGPRQFAEFVYPYQAKLAERFGKVYYGCCEPLHTRWDVLKEMPNLARASVSPWADEEKMAAALGQDVVYSRKPNPTLVSTANFDETAIRDDLRCTLTVARACRVELIMKDVHTLNNEPGRLPRWVEIAREEIDRAWG